MATVLDIECADWDQYLVGCLYRDHKVLCLTRDPDELLFEALSIRGDIWAHYGGRYDWLWLLQKLREHSNEARIFMSGSSATRIDLGKTRFRDSYRLIPMKLDKAGGMVGAHKLKLPFPCTCDQECGGYCYLSLDMPEWAWQKLEEYLVQDCEVLSDTLDYVHDFAENNGIEMRGTVGGTAWATAKKMKELPAPEWESSIYYQVRAALFGGRTECNRMGAHEIYQADIHSAYPAALHSLALPTGVPRYDTRGDVDLSRSGVFSARVRVPESLAPPLPYRGDDRIYFPTGEFSGVWSDLELRYAVEECNVEIVDWEWSYTWSEREPILADVAAHFWKLRDTAVTPELAAWIKWPANSFTGKLSQDPENRELVLSFDPDIAACPGGDCFDFCSPSRCCDHHCSGRCRKYEPIDPRGTLYARPIWRMPDCAYVHWGVYLTSYNRVELHRQIRSVGSDWVYSDTDCVKSLTEITRRIGPSLGEWGDEGRGFDWRCIAPKAYCYRDEKGEWVIRCKGLSRITPETWEAYCRGEPVKMEKGVMGLLSAARSGDSFFQRKHMSRKAVGKEGWCGGRVIIHGGVTTRAPTMEEISER